MRCCEAMLYILQMAPEFPVKPRVDSCNSPLLGHQMPPEAVFPPVHGKFQILIHWHRSAYLTCWSCSWVHWHDAVPDGSLTGKKRLLPVTSVAFCNLQPNQVICKCGLQNLEQILHFGKLTGQNCPSLFTLLGNGFINDASSRILRKFRLGAFFEPKSGLWSNIVQSERYGLVGVSKRRASWKIHQFA